MDGQNRPIGLTKSVGFQVGVRRTLPISQEEAWEALTSPAGLREWLGEIPSLRLEPGGRYTTREGTSGEIRVVRPQAQIRMTWQPQGWAKPSTLQIRLLPAGPGRTTISFHQEKLADAATRAEMKHRWEQVLHNLRARFSSSPS